MNHLYCVLIQKNKKIKKVFKPYFLQQPTVKFSVNENIVTQIFGKSILFMNLLVYISIFAN